MKNFWLSEGKKDKKIVMEIEYHTRDYVHSIHADYAYSTLVVESVSHEVHNFFHHQYQPSRTYDVRILVYEAQGVVEQWNFYHCRFYPNIGIYPYSIEVHNQNIGSISSKYF